MRNSVLCICLIWLSNFVFSQSTKDELFNQREKLKQEIELTNKLINSTKSKKGNTVQSIKLIDKKIKFKTDLISNYKGEIKIIEQKVIDREATIERLKTELVHQKEIYAEFLQYAYKQENSYSNLVYLLAANSFSQFYLRRKYLEQLNEARIEKIQLIHTIENRINIEIDELNKEKIAIGEALLIAKSESSKLTKTKSRRSSVLAELSSEEKELKKELNNKLKIEKELNKKIEELIRSETKKSSFAMLTPEEQLVGDDFSRNKGKLPWPARQGIITEKFGEHPHPVIKGVKIRNNGIDISTVQNAPVRAIFEGSVSKIFAIKGSNYTVILKHGNYYTVYHNLKEVDVKVGAKISTKQNIGTVAYNMENNSAVIHFELWNGLEKLNPELWISD